LLMHALNRILDMYKSPDTEYPGIRRVTVELIIWMLRSNRRCIEFFFRHQVDKAVKEVAETEERLDLKCLRCSAAALASLSTESPFLLLLLLQPLLCLALLEGSQARCRQRTQYQLLNLQAYE